MTFYSFDKFTSDSGDDHPTYETLVSKKPIERLEIYNEDQLEFEFVKDRDEFKTLDAALENVILLARERIKDLYGSYKWNAITADEIISRDSVDLVEEKIYKKMIRGS